MGEILYRLTDNRSLQCISNASVVKTDSNMTKVKIEINRVVDGVDVSDFRFLVHLETDGKYFEEVPIVEVLENITLTFLLTKNHTSAVGNLLLSISGRGGDQVFNSQPANLYISSTIDPGEILGENMLEIWLQQIRTAAEKLKNDVRKIVTTTETPTMEGLRPGDLVLEVEQNYVWEKWNAGEEFVVPDDSEGTRIGEINSTTWDHIKMMYLTSGNAFVYPNSTTKKIGDTSPENVLGRAYADPSRFEQYLGYGYYSFFMIVERSGQYILLRAEDPKDGKFVQLKKYELSEILTAPESAYKDQAKNDDGYWYERKEIDQTRPALVKGKGMWVVKGEEMSQ